MRLESRENFEELLLSIVNPLKLYYSEGKAGLHLGDTATSYEQAAILMEAFSRPLWGLVPLWAGGTDNVDFEEIYRQGLINGTNPKHKEFWGGFRKFDQKFVEMAAISYGLILTPEKLWDPLSETEKENLAKWLYGINEYQLPICNWILFAVLVNVALKKLGMPYDKEKLEYYLNGVEEFYLGDGWYQDGDSEQKDYYVSFAIHFYCLFYAKVMGEEDKERSEKYKERAMLFGKTFLYWFDEDGAALPFGRSLTYRFSQVSFWCACMIADVYPVSMEIMKGLIARHLNHWLSFPIFDRDHVLTIGYGYPNLIMGERYNGPGSPYWSLKTFAILMLPKNHPFWSVKAAPMPKLEERKLLKEADMLIAAYKGHTTAYTPGKYSPFGHGQTQAKYGKFAYDTKFGFSVAKSSFELHEAAPDSMLAFVINGYVYVRRISESFEVKEDQVISRWSPYVGITVETTIIPTEDGHIRKHQIESEIACIAYDCGFSVPAEPSQELVTYTDKGKAGAEYHGVRCEVFGKIEVSGKQMQAAKGNEEAAGEFGEVAGEVIYADPNTNIIYAKTVIPAVKYRITKGESCLETVVVAKQN
ncbi:DUF2264 domain-containing protein [Konateibacter massiliensis]|uniref:DUF2264 domain-containing protein n=1 Tax=Konateibacter massiliensis TaxID=2002841 RepID=UPI000C15A561|nr:DUF2264 domain-containing protein [Konateibacter massiliensis]